MKSALNVGKFVALFLFFHTANSQPFGVRQFTLQHGLPTSQIKALLKDDLGYLWIGTHGGGLVRFDGNEFISYTTRDGLVNNYVTSLCKDRQGDIWIGTLLGISRFDGLSFTNISLNLPVDASHKESMIEQLVENNDSILVLNDAGMIGIIDEGKIEWVKNTQPAKFIIAGLTPEILYQSRQDRLLSITNKKLNIELESGIQFYGVIEFLGTPVLNTNKGIFKIGENGLVNVLNSHKTGPALFNQRDSIFWTFHINLKQFAFGRNDLVLDKSFPQIFEITSWVLDEGGGLWIGTYTQGLFNLKAKEFDKFYTTDFKDPIMPIERVVEGEKTFWFGTYGNGLIKFDGKRHQTFFFKDNPRKNYVVDLKAQDSKLWIGTYGGLGVIESDHLKWLTDTDNNPIDLVLSIDLDARGRIWVGRADKGIEMIEDFRITHIPFQNKTAIAIRYAEIDSSLYIGTFQGIYKYTNGKTVKVKINKVKDGIVRALDIYKEKHLVFASEEGGIFIYNVIDGNVASIDYSDGLISPILYFVKADDDFIWVGSALGIIRIKLNENLDVKEITSFNDKNGFDGIETNSNSAYIDSEVKLFGSIDGVYSFSEVPVKKAVPGKLHFQDIILFDGEGSARKYADSLTGFFKIPYNPIFDKTANHITFKFNATSSSVSSRSKYTYILENFDNRWSKYAKTNEATYSSLPPGDYNFRVKSIDGESETEIEEISYPFSISPAFYETSWFLFLGSIGILVSIILLFRIQLRKKVNKMVMLARVRSEENHRLRQEIARDFHDELGNHLVMVSNNVNVLLLKATENDKVEVLNKIAQSIKYINLRTRDFIWSINPSNNNLDDLFLYLRDFADGLFKNSNVAFRAENKVSSTYPVSYRFSRETILIFKEAFTNILKHAHAVNVFFIMKSSNYTIDMEVGDDGIGMKIENRMNGGLGNMSYRAKKIGAGLLLDTRQNGGTRIGLSFDLDNIKN